MLNTHKSEKFNVTTQVHGETCTAFLYGELDLAVAHDFRKLMEPLVDNKDRVLELNLKDLHYMDSTGIGILLSILKVRHGMQAKLLVSEVPPKIQKLFEMTGIAKFFA